MKFNFLNLKKNKIKVGLALGGGGARGFAHIGVFKAFEEHNIHFDFVAGASAGSLAGALYCAGITSDEMKTISQTLKVKDIRKNKLPFMPSKTDGIEEVIKNTIGDIKIEELKIPFCAIATDIISGKELHITSGSVAKAVAGSCAFPAIFNPVPFNKYLLLDGGLQNNIPANVPKVFGCDVVIAVDINSTRGYGTESTKYFDMLMASMRIMMKSNSLKGYLNADVMIQPDLKRFKATKLDGTEEMIEEGYKAALFSMDKIKTVIGLVKENKKQVEKEKKLNKANKLIL